jgi:hypothetical protein
MKILSGIVFLLITLVANAQRPAKPETFAKQINVEDLRRHLFVIAGPEMEGRETATEGQRRAASYLENAFRNLGLTPPPTGSHQMPFPVYQDSLISASIEINGKKLNRDEDFSIPLSNVNTQTLLSNSVVFAGYGYSDSLQDDYRNIDVRGKVVMVLSTLLGNDGDKPRRSISTAQFLQNALKHGASAVLLVQGGFPRKAFSPRGPQYVNAFKTVNYPNLYFISENAASLIAGRPVRDLAPTGLSLTADISLSVMKTTATLSTTNVVAVIEGSDLRDQYVVITSHYDHLGKRGDSVIYYGADDDGSGTVALLELAQAFSQAKKQGKGPRRSIVFMAVSGEEKGLWGSDYYGSHPLFPLEKTSVNLNIDMIGRSDPKRTKGDSLNYIYVVGDDKLSSDLRPISESINKKYTKLELDYKFNDPADPERIYFRSDHYNFAKHGVPIIFYFNGTHNDYHRPTDTPDKINYDLLAKRIRLIYHTAWEMANRDGMMKRDLELLKVHR